MRMLYFSIIFFTIVAIEIFGRAEYPTVYVCVLSYGILVSYNHRIPEHCMVLTFVINGVGNLYKILVLPILAFFIIAFINPQILQSFVARV